MKIKRFNDNFNPYNSFEEEVESHIRDIISIEIEMSPVPYTDGDYEISSDSMDIAAKKIMDYLKANGLTNALDSSKYNL